jgi:uncharacterized protein (DUF58 family)
VNVLPTQRFLALLAGASLLFLVGPAVGVAADAALLILLAADALRVPPPDQLRVTRDAPERIPLGEQAEVRLRVANLSPRPLHLQLVDDIFPPLERVGGRVLATTLEPASETVVSYTVRADRRGAAELNHLHLRLLGALGLAWRRRRVEIQHRVLVHPSTRELSAMRLLGLRHRLKDVGVRRIRYRGEAGAFESLREYAPGDDPRTVDWKATARSTAVMVRQFEAERSQTVMVAIDAGRLMMERMDDRERLDHALSAALLLADVAGQTGDRVGVTIFSDRIHREIPPSRVSLSRLSQALAEVEPRMVESNYPAAFARIARQLRRRALLVLFSDVVDPGTSAALVGQLANSARRHLPIAVTLRSPALERSAAAPVADESDAFRRAAAEELLQARATALHTMRRAGVLVVDVLPAQAAPGVINRYLEVKARGRL